MLGSFGAITGLIAALFLGIFIKRMYNQYLTYRAKSRRKKIKIVVSKIKEDYNKVLKEEEAFYEKLYDYNSKYRPDHTDGDGSDRS